MRDAIELGATGPEVFGIGLGCMGMSGVYGPADEAESVRTIHAAMAHAPVLVDTGDFYAMGHNEALVARALKDKRDRAVVSVKFGALRGPDGSWFGIDTRPAAVKTFAAYSLQRLGVEVIDIYRPARLDPSVPIEDTVGAIADLVKAGYVKHIGLSEVGAETIRRAHAVHPIVDVQIEYALVSRSPEAKVFPALHELGIGATLYGVMSRGLLSGSQAKGPGDFRRFLPRFAEGNREKNASVVEGVHRFAEERGMTPGQLAIAWVRAKEPKLLPLIGCKTTAQWSDALGALAHPLSKDDVAALEALVPADAVAGTRYAAEQMKHLDSER
ncbi:MAG: aldo/keto reductase [Sandaracinaceae bacterium]